MKHTIQIFCCSLLLSCNTIVSFSQGTIPPQIARRALNWGVKTPSDPTVVPGPGYIGNDVTQAQNGSAEDWWYDVKPIYTNGIHTGYVTCGFTRYINMTFSEQNTNPVGFLPGEFSYGPESVKSCNQRLITNQNISDYKQTVAVFDLDGKMLWCKPQNVGGPFLSVMQTPDGGFIAIGDCRAAYNVFNQQFKYNPTSAASPTILSQIVAPLNPRYYYNDRINVTKLNANGDAEWTYLYGIVDLNSTALTNTERFRSQKVYGLDIDINPAGGYTIVGNGNSSDANGKSGVVVMNLTDLGFIVPNSKQFYIFQNGSTILDWNVRAMDCENGNCFITGGISETAPQKPGTILKLNQTTLMKATDWGINPLQYPPNQTTSNLIQDIHVNSDNTMV